mgnify:CR=1 FL=1
MLTGMFSVAAAQDDGEAISPRDVYVMDGDTIRVKGETFRLVGFDAPEIGNTARCEREVEIGAHARREQMTPHSAISAGRAERSTSLGRMWA